MKMFLHLTHLHMFGFNFITLLQRRGEQIYSHRLFTVPTSLHSQFSFYFYYFLIFQHSSFEEQKLIR